MHTYGEVSVASTPARLEAQVGGAVLAVKNHHKLGGAVYLVNNVADVAPAPPPLLDVVEDVRSLCAANEAVTDD